MNIGSLGHVVVKVTDLERSEAFYSGVLGLPINAHFDQDGMKMTFFTLGNHHDFAISLVKGEGSPEEQSVGLDHVAFNIGTSLDELREAKTYLEAAGLKLNPVDHGVTQSLYFSDPDGNGVEVYVDTSDAWREDPQQVAQGFPLEL